MTIKVLIVGNEKDIVDEKLMEKYFQEKKVKVVLEDNKKNVLEQFYSIEPNVVIIDNFFSEEEALTICKKIKKISTTPIIYLSANSDPDKIISSFDAGIDDYIMKPCQRNVLTAKIIANSIKKTNSPFLHKNSRNPKILKFHNLEINLEGYYVKSEGKQINLIAKEMKILSLLVQNPNKVFSADELYQLIWGTESFGDARTVMVHISNLRKKIESNPNKPKFIQTVRGFGYKFCLPEK